MGIFGTQSIDELITRKNVKGLIKALKDDDEYVRRRAASVLGEIGDKRAIEPLTKALKDEDSYVRKATAEALKKIKEKKTYEPQNLYTHLP